MSDTHLHRGDAPFGEGVWNVIDATVTGVAKARMTARRLLHVDGPHGLALKAFGGGECGAAGTLSNAVALRVPCMVPVPGIESAFSLSARDVAAFEGAGHLLDVGPAAQAAAACAAQEDALVFNGAASLGLQGLMTARGVQSCKLTAWKEIGAAVDNILQGVSTLDGAGFHGPYALALAPALFNLLFRRYPQGDATELDHLRLIVSDGCIKTAAVSGGGVLVAAGKELAAIVVGQDLAVAFEGPSGRDYAFVVSETVGLRLTEPASVCVLK